MLKKVRCVILKVREFYYRRLWLYCVNNYKKYETNKDYQSMYEWKDKATDYHNKRKYVTERLWRIDL